MILSHKSPQSKGILKSVEIDCIKLNDPLRLSVFVAD